MTNAYFLFVLPPVRVAHRRRNSQNYFDRFCEAYNEVCEKFPNAVERDTRDGFEVLNEGKRVAYFSQVGIDFE